MNICEKKHDQIVFDGMNCPLCEAIVDAENLTDQIEKLQEYTEKTQ